jgi:hypothetical protein
VANRPYLLCHDSDAPLVASEDGEQAIVAAASNQLPVLWLCLFQPADLMTVDMPLEDIEGHQSVGPVPTLFANLKSARASWRDREPSIRGVLPAELHRHVDEWERLLGGLPGQFVQIDLAELWMMDDPDAFEESLKSYLAGLDGTSPDGRRELLDQGCLDDPEVARYGLRGYQWDRPVPWED